MIAHKKGQLLESAVSAIEGAILQSDPQYSQDTARIECRKRVRVEGVQHEIDVWVQFENGRGYSSIFIFECKNWVEPVGKNEVIVLSEKVKAVSAQRGFLVAQSLTADAEAQLRKDNRLTFLRASTLPADLVDLITFSVVAIEEKSGELEIVRPEPHRRGEQFDVKQTELTLRGELMAAEFYINDWMFTLVDRYLSEFQEGLADGIYPLKANDTRSYAAGELMLGGHEVSRLNLAVELTLHVTKPRVVSAYNVETRGRAAVIEAIALPDGGKLDMVVAREQP